MAAICIGTFVMSFALQAAQTPNRLELDMTVQRRPNNCASCSAHVNAD